MKLSKLIHTLSWGRYQKKENKMSEVTEAVETTKGKTAVRYSAETKREVVDFLKSKAVEKNGHFIIPRGTHKAVFAKYGMTYLTQIRIFRKEYPVVTEAGVA